MKTYEPGKVTPEYPPGTLVKKVTAYGRSVVIICDGRCDKAWGMSRRPRTMLSEDVDDYAYKADSELGEAPADPGTYEGGRGKPSAAALADPEMMNKWCFRECERSTFYVVGTKPLPLPSFDPPVPNMGWRTPRD